MPGLVRTASLGTALRQIVQRLRALETQQQSVVSNAAGQPVVQFGALVNSAGTVTYGMQLLDPATGMVVMFVGVDASGSPGVHIYNPSGTEEVLLGELSSSPAIYGLGVLPPAGAPLQQVTGMVGFYAANVTNATNTALVQCPGNVSAVIGPSGAALVTLSAIVSTGGSNQFGYMSTTYSGAAGFAPELALSSTAGGVAASISNTVIQTGLTPGTNTFGIGYQVSAGATVTFDAPQLTVQPL